VLRLDEAMRCVELAHAASFIREAR
jgi:hypothetical protein